MSTDLHTLTGAYALHAVSDTERVAFGRHLADCASCGQEVRELWETAARLGMAAAATPPPHLRHTVLARIHTERQTRAPRRRALATRLLAGAAAVLLAVTVSLGVLVVQSGHQLDQAHHRTDALATVLHAGDAHVTHAEGVTTVVSRTQNRGVLLTDLPPPPSGRTYQVWAIDARYHSAGLIVGGITEFTGITTASHVAVTIEPAGGSTQPTATPIVLVAIP